MCLISPISTCPTPPSGASAVAGRSLFRGSLLIPGRRRDCGDRATSSEPSPHQPIPPLPCCRHQTRERNQSSLLFAIEVLILFAMQYYCGQSEQIHPKTQGLPYIPRATRIYDTQWGSNSSEGVPGASMGARGLRIWPHERHLITI